MQVMHLCIFYRKYRNMHLNAFICIYAFFLTLVITVKLHYFTYYIILCHFRYYITLHIRLFYAILNITLLYILDYTGQQKKIF